MYCNYLNKFDGKNFVRTTSQNFNQDHDILSYHTRAPQCDANISTLVCSPVHLFERGTQNALILRRSEKVHRRIKPGVQIWFLLEPALLAQWLVLVWAQMMCPPGKVYWLPLYSIPHPPLVTPTLSPKDQYKMEHVPTQWVVTHTL